MGLTVTKTGDWQIIAGNARMCKVQIAFDSSYPTGGESLTAADLGLKTIDFISIQAKNGLVFEYDYTNFKVLAFTQGILVGTAGSATLDDYPVTAGPGVTGSLSVSFDNAIGAGTHRFGALKEVPSTNDLSTVTGVRIFAIGV